MTQDKMVNPKTIPTVVDPRKRKERRELAIADNLLKDNLLGETIRKREFGGLDLWAEWELIQQKKSQLPSKKRKQIKFYMENKQANEGNGNELRRETKTV